MPFWSGDRQIESKATLGLSPAGIANWIRDAGFKAVLEEQGQPICINSGMGGWNIAIYCYGATEVTALCENIQFRLQLQQDENISAAEMKTFVNDFNLQWRYAAASISKDGILNLQMDVFCEATSTVLLLEKCHGLFSHFVEDLVRRSRERFYGGKT